MNFSVIFLTSQKSTSSVIESKKREVGSVKTQLCLYINKSCLDTVGIYRVQRDLVVTGHCK
jgi:hypothetical protein